MGPTCTLCRQAGAVHCACIAAQLLVRPLPVATIKSAAVSPWVCILLRHHTRDAEDNRFRLRTFAGLWRGSNVAVKTMVLPAKMSGAEKRERMAVMEAAISSAM